MTDKLRTITDQTWSRDGSRLVCRPLSGNELKFARENLRLFGLTPEELPRTLGTSFTFDLEQAHTDLAGIDKAELRSWARGED